jgi:uncharacterized protein YbjT (DUF2867 family)
MIKNGIYHNSARSSTRSPSATGQQGGGVVRALHASGEFKVRALTRDPDRHPGLADEVVKADLDRLETFKAAFEGVHGVFLVTNFSEQGTDELRQATAAVHAARDACVKHFVWSTLPDAEAISGRKFDVPHFTGKARVDRVVKEAGFANYTFVIAPFYYGNLTGILAPQKQADGSVGWTLPIDPTLRVIHMGDITELGDIVTGAFAQPDEAGNGEYLPLVGDFMSFNEILDTLNGQGHKPFIQTGAEGKFRGSVPRRSGNCRDVRLLGSPYVPWFGIDRPNCPRKQNSRQTADEVFGMGEGQFPRPSRSDLNVRSGHPVWRHS